MLTQCANKSDSLIAAAYDAIGYAIPCDMAGPVTLLIAFGVWFYGWAILHVIRENT